MSTIYATMQFSLAVSETKTAAEVPLGEDRTATYNAADRFRLSADSGADAPAAQAIATQYTGSQSIDLTNFTGSQGAGQDASGLKVQAVLLRNNSTSYDVVLNGGVSNEYELNDGADKTVQPGCSWQEFFNDQLADVDGTHKVIDITAQAGETFDLIVLLG